MNKIQSHCAKVQTAQGTIYYHEITPAELHHRWQGNRQQWAESLLDLGDRLLRTETEFSKR
jgi:hypothetical protein